MARTVRLAVVGMAFAGCSAATLRVPAQVLVEAHRGNSISAPENTIAAINAAAGVADLTEFDVRVTADGRLVLMHDSTVNRTTDGSGSLSGFTTAQLDALDAGSWFSTPFAGERIPSMVEAMDASYNAGIIPLVEQKTGSALTYHNEFVAEGFSPSTFRVISFDWDFLNDLDALNSDYQLGALGSGTLDQSDIDNAIAKGADFLDWSHSSITQASVDLAHQNGLELHVYTVNSEARMNELIGFGIDGITTDDPTLLNSIVPEPGSLALLGLSGLLLLRRRRA